jgi:hypothetical protein
MATGGPRARRSSASTVRAPAGPVAPHAPRRGATFCAWEPQTRAEAGHGGHPHPEALPLEQPRTAFCQRRLGLRTQHLAHRLLSRRIAAGLAASCVGPRSHRASAAAALPHWLDNRAADATQGCPRTWGAESGLIGTKDVLTEIERRGLHAHHAKARLPFILLQTALGEARDYLRDAPWTMLFPWLSITLTVLALNLLGDGTRDVLDPRLRKV